MCSHLTNSGCCCLLLLLLVWMVYPWSNNNCHHQIIKFMLYIYNFLLASIYQKQTEEYAEDYVKCLWWDNTIKSEENVFLHGIKQSNSQASKQYNIIIFIRFSSIKFNFYSVSLSLVSLGHSKASSKKSNNNKKRKLCIKKGKFVLIVLSFFWQNTLEILLFCCLFVFNFAIYRN